MSSARGCSTISGGSRRSSKGIVKRRFQSPVAEVVRLRKQRLSEVSRLRLPGFETASKRTRTRGRRGDAVSAMQANDGTGRALLPQRRHAADGYGGPAD